MPAAKDDGMSSTYHPQSTSAMSTASSSPLEATFPSILNPSPITITEILLHIGSFLNTRSLRNALCVSRGWHTTLYPLLWQQIYLWQDPDEFNPDPDIGPSFSNLRQHASLVKSLEVYSHKFAASCGPDPNDGDNPLFFPNLAVLDIDTHYYKAIKNHAIFSFLERHHSTIKDLTISIIDQMTELLQVLSHGFPLLTHLSIKKWRLWEQPSVFMDLYDTLWPGLLSLSLDCLVFSYPGLRYTQNIDKIIRQLEQAPATTLQDLNMYMPVCFNPDQIRLQLLMILKSLNLTRLKWITWCTIYNTYSEVEEEEVVEEGPMAQLARVIQSGQFHQGRKQQQQQQQQRRPLESLCLGETSFRIKDLDIVLGALKCGLKELSLYKTNFDKDSWNVIKDRYPIYLSTITVLDLDGCSLLKGPQVHDILCSITSLEVFRADYLRGSNLERDRRSWVCLGLKELSLGFVRRTRRGQCLFLDQLSRLSLLEVLNLHKSSPESEIDDEEEVLEVVGATGDKESDRRNVVVDVDSKCQRTLLLTLMEGLDCLRPLRGLRHLKGPNNHRWNDGEQNCRHCVWTEVEARWAVENWKGLEKLSNIRLTRRVWNVLEEHVSLSFRDVIEWI
ncbi:hypothetical protein BGZ83_011879 [Gryganskiella cystojenkinii]|nr:hypothetical protein BGZ83_011879 [Gryganskiella cystojenkinii]